MNKHRLIEHLRDQSTHPLLRSVAALQSGLVTSSVACRWLGRLARRAVARDMELRGTKEALVVVDALDSGSLPDPSAVDAVKSKMESLDGNHGGILMCVWEAGSGVLGRARKAAFRSVMWRVEQDLRDMGFDSEEDLFVKVLQDAMKLEAESQAEDLARLLEEDASDKEAS